MNTLKAGFGRVDFTPPLGIHINGYYIDRYAQEILDPLEINCMALRCGDATVALISVDNMGIYRDILDDTRRKISEATGIPFEAVYIHCTHSHTCGTVYTSRTTPLEVAYKELLPVRALEAVEQALADLKPAKMGFGTGLAPNIAFSRRYRMKDGSVRTNPGVNNPDILEPIGEVDQRVNVLRFDREDGETLVLMNFGMHPDCVGGNRISADWPGFARRTVETALPGTKAVLFNGAEGEVNHVNTAPKGGDMNNLSMDFDDVARGYGYSRYLGRVIAGAVLQTYDRVEYVDVDKIAFVQKTIRIPSNMPKPEELPQAYRYKELHEAGLDDQIPYTGMQLTTVVAEAIRMCRLENGPEYFEMPLTAVSVGNVAFVGLPGEPFTGISWGLKAAPGWDMILPTCNTNSREGYFPMQDCYDEGGYETRSSNFKAGVGELMIREGLTLLAELKN